MHAIHFFVKCFIIYDFLSFSIILNRTWDFSHLLCHLIVLGAHGLGISHSRLPGGSEFVMETFSVSYCPVV